MANDRVMLRCRGCDDRFCLLRYMPGALSLSWTFRDLERWLTKHCERCHSEVFTNTLEDDPRFVTETE